MSKVSHIPTVSLKDLEKNNAIIAHNLGNALRSCGFVYLTDHGIPEEKISKVFDASVDFFSLPLNVKMNYPRDFEQTYHGYTQIGEEMFAKNSPTELRETFDISLHNISQLPYPDKEVPHLRHTSHSLIQECHKLAKVILQLLPAALGLEDDDLGDIFSTYHKIFDDPSVQNYSQFRTLYYPKIDGSHDSSVVGHVRCGAHTDFGTFTFLFQDAVGGLQLQQTDGKWIPATPKKGAILMNTADLLNIWSGGQFPSTIHRVVVPEEEIRQKVARQSVAYFLKPDNDIVVTPIVGKSTAETIPCGKDLFQLNNKWSANINAGEHFRKRTANHRKVF